MRSTLIFDLASQLADSLRVEAEFEGFEPQNLSIVCFRYVPRRLSGDVEAINSLHKVLLERVQLGGQAFLSSTVIKGTFWLRACIVNSRTSPNDIKMLVETVRAAGADSLA